MSRNARQLKTVISTAGLVAAVLIGTFAALSSRAHKRTMLASLRRGLEDAYDQALAASPRTPAGQAWISNSAVRLAFLATDKRRLLPSFVDVTNVFLSAEAVPVPSNLPVCAVRLDWDRTYGISGGRGWKEITSREFAAWPHEPLIADHIPSVRDHSK